MDLRKQKLNGFLIIQKYASKLLAFGLEYILKNYRIRYEVVMEEVMVEYNSFDRVVIHGGLP